MAHSSAPTLSDARGALHRHFGHDAFRPGQERLIGAILGGRDAFGVLPTGAGKSLCYQIPALLLPGVVLVVSPLISLMEDQVRRAERAGIRAGALSSTLRPGAGRELLGALEGGTLRILFVAPERFAIDSFRRAIGCSRVSLLAIDEAHCISEWGHDFRPEYRRLARARPKPSTPVLALTASATPAVRADVRAVLRLRRPVEVVGSFDRPNLSWHLARVPDHGARTAAIRRLVRVESGSGAAIVYAGTRRAAEAIRRSLQRRGILADAYHAGLRPAVRAQVQERFLSGRSRVVVATNAFGMGIDRSDVRLVVHYQLPGTLESYYQESGRAGRDGAPARCVALLGPRDDTIHRRFTDRSHPPTEVVRSAHRRMLALAGGAGEPLRVDPASLLRSLRHPEGPEGALHVLFAVERAGGVRFGAEPRAELESAAERILRGTGRASEGSLAGVRVLEGLPSLARLESLRRAARSRARAVRRWARGRGCRRAGLLAYFGERPSPGPGVRCDRCDRCLGAADPVLGLIGRARPMRSALLRLLSPRG